MFLLLRKWHITKSQTVFKIYYMAPKIGCQIKKLGIGFEGTAWEQTSPVCLFWALTFHVRPLNYVHINQSFIMHHVFYIHSIFYQKLFRKKILHSVAITMKFHCNGKKLIIKFLKKFKYMLKLFRKLNT